MEPGSRDRPPEGGALVEVRGSVHHGLATCLVRGVAAGALLLAERPLVAVDLARVEEEAARVAACRKEGGGEAVAARVVQLCAVLHAFLALTKEEQEQFLQLHDAFDYLAEPDEHSLEVRTIEVALFKEIVVMEREAAARVWGVYCSNQQAGRLGIQVTNLIVQTAFYICVKVQ